MKLTTFEGIVHDLSNHLDFEIWHGRWTGLKLPLKRDVINGKNPFDRYCVDFVKKRLPATFDTKQIEEILVKIERTMTTSKTTISIRVKGRIFSKSTSSSLC